MNYKANKVQIVKSATTMVRNSAAELDKDGFNVTELLQAVTILERWYKREKEACS